MLSLEARIPTPFLLRQNLRARHRRQYRPGFDFLGYAVDGIGDYVRQPPSRPGRPPGEVSISGGGSKISKNPYWNCAGIAAIVIMKMLHIRSVGLSLSLDEGLPLGSVLGSSAASAAAEAVAVRYRKIWIKCRKQIADFH